MLLEVLSGGLRERSARFSKVCENFCLSGIDKFFNLEYQFKSR